MRRLSGGAAAAARFGVPALVGVVVAVALLWLMQWMVLREADGVSAQRQGAVIEFVRLKHDTQTRLKQRRQPEEPPEEPDPPPRPPAVEVEMEMARPAAPHIDMVLPKLPLAFDGPFLGPMLKGQPDRDFIPISRVPPRYPYRAERRGIEGWVKLSFLITAEGEVRDAVVIDAEPEGVFDRAALNAVLKWRFKPRLVDGKPVAVRAEQVVNFQLNREEAS